MSSALQKLNMEDPSFEIKRNPETAQLLIGGQGMTHIGYILDKLKSNRDRLIFADKMPMQYFIHEFGLDVSAAFSGCSTETEPSSGTIAGLIDTVKKEEIPVVLYIELSTGNIAKTISEETGCEMMQIQSFHNVTKNDFENGETYVSLMTRNLDVLKKALQ